MLWCTIASKVVRREGAGGMREDDDGVCSPDAPAAAGHGSPVDSYTLVVRLSSGVELEYDLDPGWFVGHMRKPSS